MHRRAARSGAAEILILVAKHHGHHWILRLLERKSTNAEIMPKPIVQVLESTGPLVPFPARMHNQIMPRCRDLETTIELMLQHLSHFGSRVGHEARTCFHCLFGEFWIEVVQSSVATEQQHLLR